MSAGAVWLVIASPTQSGVAIQMDCFRRRQGYGGQAGKAGKIAGLQPLRPLRDET